MAFFDWWGFLGTGIQSAFAWIAYNRDGFADNVSYRQNQKYQQKNYNISWIAIARDDIRDMMGISVNRINNYMIVATLILSVAAGAIMSVKFDEECPGFIVFAFYLSIGISLIFLMLAIMFGVKGQNSAFTNTMKLLTYQVRPENPAEYTHDYMKQSQWIERNGLSQLFRIPGLLPTYNTDTQKDHMQKLSQHMDGGNHKHHHTGVKRKSNPDKMGSHYRDAEDFMHDINLEDATPLESLVQRSSHTWYLTKFAEFMRLWHPYDMYSKYAMGCGILCLCHGATYFTLGYLVTHPYAFSEFAAMIVTVSFLIMVALIVNSNFKGPNTFLRLGVVFLVSCGPGLAAIGAVTSSDVIRKVVVPLAFMSHTFFWCAAFGVSQQREWQDDAVNFVNSGAGFWKSKYKYKSQKDGDAEKASSKATSYEEWKRAEERKEEEWRQRQAAGLGNETIGKAQLPSREADKAMLGQSVCLPTGSACQGSMPQQRHAAQHQDMAATGASLEMGDSSPESSAKTAPHDPNDSSSWPTADHEFEIRASGTSRNIRVTTTNTIVACGSLWLAMTIWAIMRYWIEWGSTSRILVSDAVEAANQPSPRWPNPLFRPTLLACAGGQTYASDGFKIYQLGLDGAQAKRVPCPGITQRVKDLDVACDNEGCRPLALLHSGKTVVDCLNGGASRLADDTEADGFTMLDGFSEGPGNMTDRRMLLAHQGRLVSHIWMPEQKTWIPDAFLGDVPFLTHLGGIDDRKLRAGEGLLSLGHAGTSDLLLVRKLNVPGKAIIEARDVETMTAQSVWKLPDSLPNITGACAENKSSVLVLLSASTAAGSGQPGLVRLSLSEYSR